MYIHLVNSILEGEEYNRVFPRGKHVDHEKIVFTTPFHEALDVIDMGLLGNMTPGAPGAVGQGAPRIAETHGFSLARRDIPEIIPKRLNGVCEHEYVWYD